MKQFNLEEYIKNPKRKVITRDGKDVRILCTDKKDDLYPIVGLTFSYNQETINNWTRIGSKFLDGNSPDDLFFAPEKHEGYINVYKDGDCYYFGADYPYATEKEAKEYSVPTKDGIYDYVGTIKVEWED